MSDIIFIVLAGFLFGVFLQDLNDLASTVMVRSVQLDFSIYLGSSIYLSWPTDSPDPSLFDHPED